MVNSSNQNFWRAIGAAIVLFVAGSCGSTYAADEKAVEIRIDSHTALRLSTKGHSPLVELITPKRVAVTIGSGTRSSLARASDYFVVGQRAISRSGQTFFLLITQTPSQAASRTGYCGAGTEDVLRLLELVDSGRRLVQRDELRLQSCLDNLSLTDDTGRSLRRQYEHADPDSLSFTWLEHPKFGNVAKSLAVENGSLVLE